MAKKNEVESTQIELTPEEIQAVLKARENISGGLGNSDTLKELTRAFIEAFNATKPPEKKTPFTRKKGGPWEPKDGKPKPKLRRVMYQHGIELQEAQLSPEEIDLLNKIKAGSYCGGHIRVIKRRDKSLDIEYPVRTASQRLKLVNSFGITSFASLLQRLITEAANPQQFKDEDDD